MFCWEDSTLNKGVAMKSPAKFRVAQVKKL